MVFNAVTKYRHCSMPFSNKVKAVIRNLYQFKEYVLLRLLTEFLKTKCKRKERGILLRRSEKHEAPI